MPDARPDRPVHVVAAVLRDARGRILLARRTAGRDLAGAWEFPGGKVEPGETDEAALLREIKHRIGVEVTVGSKAAEHVHDYSRYEVHMLMFACKLLDGAVPYPATVADLRWVTSKEFLDYEFPPADESTLSRLLGLMRN